MEMLIAVAIVGVLAALAVPLFRTSVENAKQAKCVSNLRQIASAAIMFASDNGGRPPYGGWFAGGSVLFDGDPRMWYCSLEGYLNNDRRVFTCPSGKDHLASTWLLWPDGAKYASHYGYNICLNWPDQPTQISTLAGAQRPGKTPMVMDINFQAFVPYWDYDGNGPNPDAGTALAPRHNKRGNVAWLDGHVSSERFEDLNAYAKKAGGGENFLTGKY